VREEAEGVGIGGGAIMNEVAAHIAPLVLSMLVDAVEEDRKGNRDASKWLRAMADDTVKAYSALMDAVSCYESGERPESASGG